MAEEQENAIAAGAASAQNGHSDHQPESMPGATADTATDTQDGSGGGSGERPAKRLRREASPDLPSIPASSADLAMTDAPANPHDVQAEAGVGAGAPPPMRGVAAIKAEYLIPVSELQSDQSVPFDDDAAEGRENPAQDSRDSRDDRDRRNNRKNKHDRKKKEKGQNKDRQFGLVDDVFRLCNTRAFAPEFSPAECRFGDSCKNSHDLRKYLAEGRREDSGTETFRGGPCPVFDKFGRCYSGWKCRFVKTHMKEVEHEDGRKELVLVEKAVDGVEGEAKTSDDVETADAVAEASSDGTSGDKTEKKTKEAGAEDQDSAESIDTAAKADDEGTDGYEKSDAKDETDGRPDVVNVIGIQAKIDLSRRRLDFSRADQYIKWMNSEAEVMDSYHTHRKNQEIGGVQDLRARYVDPPFLPSEKRRIYFGPETPVLAPLTTQGNIPFRRLCVELGAQLTYSEMAMSMHLLQGNKNDWTLLKAHSSETEPPRFSPETPDLVPTGYDHSRDLRFGAQISAATPWSAVKAADVLSRLCPHLRLIDLNCGCPIDMIFKSGGGSALLDAPNKLERMIRGMNTMSGETPITAKIRTGVKTNRPNAAMVIGKLAFGSREHRDKLGAPGCAAITLHGRSREMRYTKQADWGYIAECASLVKMYNEQRAKLADTAAEPDERTQAAAGRMFFVGNGDCYSHEDYYSHMGDARVDSIMIGRGALVKPWLFEEIEKRQYLDKRSSERLAYVEKFVRHGLETWGSDEVGVTFTRRFLLEWLSFSHRYVPIGLLEYLPPSLNDRPPPFRGRDEMETLLASSNYRDWIKISEMYLGPVHPGFQFQPKHKSHAYEAEG